jgi:hypothetical protein
LAEFAQSGGDHIAGASGRWLAVDACSGRHCTAQRQIEPDLEQYIWETQSIVNSINKNEFKLKLTLVKIL